MIRMIRRLAPWTLAPWTLAPWTLAPWTLAPWTLAPWTLALWLAFAVPSVQAGPFTVDDMLGSEAFGSVSLSPDETRVLFERQGPYESAGRFDLGALGRWSTSEIWVADTRNSAPARRLLPQEVGRGVILGSWSPSGRRLLVHRLQADRWESGVVEMASGSVRWLGVGAEPPVKGETALWRSDDELILVVRTDGDLPYEIGALAAASRLTGTRRTTARDGGAATTVWGAGAYARRSSFTAKMRTLRIDLRTGAQSPLAEGPATDLALSEDGRWLALVDRGPPNAVDPDAPLRPGDLPEQRRLTILDLEGGGAWRPCAECDVAPGLLSWSDEGNLLVWVRETSRGPVAGRLLALEPGGRTVSPLSLGDLEPDVGAHRDAAFVTIRAGWVDGRAVILARQRGASRTDWYGLEAGVPRNLTAGLPASPGGLEAVWDTGFMVFADGAAWSIGTDGRAIRRPQPTAVSAVATLTHWASPRLRLNSPARRRWVQARDPDGGLWRVPDRGRPVRIATTGATPSALRALGRNLAVDLTVDHGVERLRLLRPDRPERSLSAVNPEFAAIRFADALPIASADTSPVTRPAGPTASRLGVLYAPPGGLRPATPLVVVAYPGASGRVPDNPAEFSPMANAQLIAAMGYAVLVPTLAGTGSDGPAAGLTSRILSILDATLAQYPDLDGSRVGYLGHSFGGYTGMILATQTDRFRSFVILSAPADPAGSWGTFAAFGRANPEFGVTSRRNAGWAERGQGAMGGPPWAEPEAYRRNSALHQASGVTAPVLLLHGELDFVPITQAETFFTALWRQDKDVQLVTYWGEQHLFASPGNIRDVWSRVDRWFAETLGVSPARLTAPLPAAPSAEPRLPSTPPLGSVAPRPASAGRRPAAGFP